GDTGNQGPHQFDVGRWGINKFEYPVKVYSAGGVVGWGPTQQETPNEQLTIFQYADGTIFEFATRGLNTNKDAGIKVGNIFYGSEGRLELNSDTNSWEIFLGPQDEPGPKSE